MRFFLIFCFLINLYSKEMGLREQISEMIMVGFNGQKYSDKDVRIMISDLHYPRFGGVVLFGRNIQNKSQLTKLINLIKQERQNILVAIDEEGGEVSRLVDSSFGEKTLSAYKVGANFDINSAKIIYEKLAKKLQDCGVNMNFAPVVDLHDVNSKIIGQKERAYSQNSQKVSLYANIFADSLHKFNIINTFKHFPGHGRSKQDSHKEKTYVNITADDIFAYKEAIRLNKIDTIMVGHIFVNNIDDKNPASLSNTIINLMLRKELGFDGVVISDDMLMGGLGNYTLKEKIIKFINAGGDIMLFSEFKIKNKRVGDVVYECILDAIKNGEITKERIKKSYKRIMKLKEKI
ncbi:glycoside hydrolase family 3 N-terminal domain-containing protein [Campylobacter pinnipediorum]|uniref:beta-N-acetylhexosaminidase n=1 Tax=Campylobacter pinnipediorum subsp. pinnipediorum TaxID=1660067 RepID=A0AAX0LAM4_9BACT|nr:glycoside hydrolase family 3 N-terminal domain-containing protein [Campylobacter pinnipediorum]AQW81182.1 glycosyl hydrolase, family 3 [Campylobacter pinnipediorum subsp. pinnipediorum]OPA77969.1 glycosyl hydrolase [Campylobacter pinnipediorum subsp. pinnipediorum]